MGGPKYYHKCPNMKGREKAQEEGEIYIYIYIYIYKYICVYSFDSFALLYDVNGHNVVKQFCGPIKNHCKRIKK